MKFRACRVKMKKKEYASTDKSVFLSCCYFYFSSNEYLLVFYRCDETNEGYSRHFFSYTDNRKIWVCFFFLLENFISPFVCTVFSPVTIFCILFAQMMRSRQKKKVFFWTSQCIGNRIKSRCIDWWFHHFRVKSLKGKSIFKSKYKSSSIHNEPQRIHLWSYSRN